MIYEFESNGSSYRNNSIGTIDRDKYENRALNEGKNYSLSPAAKHAMKDGSLDQNHYLNKTFNRKMRMRDTFTVLFPGYEHGQYTNCVPKQMTSLKSLISHKNLPEPL